MNVDSAVLDKHLKKTTLTSNLLSIGISLIISVCAILGFFYKTNDTLASHTQEITEVKTEVKEITKQVNDAQVFQGASSEQIKALQDQVTDVKNTQNRMIDKLDRLLSRIK